MPEFIIECSDVEGNKIVNPGDVFIVRKEVSDVRRCFIIEKNNNSDIVLLPFDRLGIDGLRNMKIFETPPSVSQVKNFIKNKFPKKTSEFYYKSEDCEIKISV